MTFEKFAKAHLRHSGLACGVAGGIQEFIFFLDPVNYWLGGRSLWRDLKEGKPKTLYSLLGSGLVCGWLWEFWNYWAGAKWHYTVPILGHIKIFEMPFLGYLGFPPFAVECFILYEFLKKLFGTRKGS